MMNRQPKEGKTRNYVIILFLVLTISVFLSVVPSLLYEDWMQFNGYWIIFGILYVFLIINNILPLIRKEKKLDVMLIINGILFASIGILLYNLGLEIAEYTAKVGGDLPFYYNLNKMMAVNLMIKSSYGWFFFSIIIVPFIYYVLYNAPKASNKEKNKINSVRRCPNCGRNIPEDARTCPYCSKKFW